MGIEIDGYLGTTDSLDFSLLKLRALLNTASQERLARLFNNWRFYLGYHWDGIPKVGSPQITSNYCRALINKLVAFEIGKGFRMQASEASYGIPINSNGEDVFQFLSNMWDINHRQSLLNDIGITKSVTGEAWLTCNYKGVGEFEDPYNEFPNGKLDMVLLPTMSIFPEYSPYDRHDLIKLTLAYEYTTNGAFDRRLTTKVYKQTWDKEKCIIEDGEKPVVTLENIYGIIPFVCIKNIQIAGLSDGVSDIDDLKMLNAEYNMKTSNVSEILDYHAAPTTVVYGAKLQNLARGANKMWGGLSKDARIENLELKGDLQAAYNYLGTVKQGMCDVANVPYGALSGDMAISNTSGVALSILNAPLIEKTRLKRPFTEEGLEDFNSLVLLCALKHGIIKEPDGLTGRDFFKTQIQIPDTLPKDELLELQQIQILMSLGLMSRLEAADKLGLEDFAQIANNIAIDSAANPQFYGLEAPTMNSGFTNGQTTNETVRTEEQGQNGERNTQ